MVDLESNSQDPKKKSSIYDSLKFWGKGKTGQFHYRA